MATKRSDTKQKKLRVLRRALVLPYAAAALLLLPLVLMKRWDSRVVADVTVREMAFDFGGGVLVDSRAYPSVHIMRGATAELRSGADVTRLKIPAEGSLTFERPRLDSLQIGNGARVTLARSDASTLAISVARGSAGAELTVPAHAVVECEYCEVDGIAQEHFQTTLDGDANVTVSSERTQFRITLTTEGAAPIAEGVRIANPTFVTGSAEEPSSSIVADGEVTLRDVPGFAIRLLKGDALEFSQPHDFTITKVETAPDGLHVVMNGWAREVRSGTLVSTENRMPSLLHRLHVNQALALYFMAVVFVAGTALNVLRQLRVIQEPK